MFTATQKREENIAEYILYIWQLEDLLRALKFDYDQIYQVLVAPTPYEEAQKEALWEWYLDICSLLREENKVEKGHIDHTLHLISDLYDLHLLMLKSEAGREYTGLFLELAPHLEQLKKRIDESYSNDIELCFRALYGVMLQRIKNPQSFDRDVLELISPVIAHLSSLYQKIERGEIDPYKNQE